MDSFIQEDAPHYRLDSKAELHGGLAQHIQQSVNQPIAEGLINLGIFMYKQEYSFMMYGTVDPVSSGYLATTSGSF